MQRRAKHIPVNPNLSYRGKNLLSSGAAVLIKAHNIQFAWHVLDTGGEMPTLVLLHGNSSSMKIWNEAIDHFQANYRVVAVDFPGHGLSSKIQSIDAVEDSDDESADAVVDLTDADKEILAADLYNPLSLTLQLDQVFQQLSIRGAHVLGWGLGGNIAYALAAIAPASISKIATVDAPPVRFSPAGLTEGFSAWFAEELVGEWINRPTFLSREVSRAIAESMEAGEDEDFISDLMHTDPLMRKHLFAARERFAEDPLYADMDAKQWAMTTDVALLLMTCGNSKAINKAYLLECAKHFKNSESAVHIEENASHILFKKEREKFYSRVSNFFQPQRLSQESQEFKQKLTK